MINGPLLFQGEWQRPTTARYLSCPREPGDLPPITGYFNNMTRWKKHTHCFFVLLHSHIVSHLGIASRTASASMSSAFIVAFLSFLPAMTSTEKQGCEVLPLTIVDFIYGAVESSAYHAQIICLEAIGIEIRQMFFMRLMRSIAAINQGCETQTSYQVTATCSPHELPSLAELDASPL